MQLTHLGHSCMLAELGDRRILIDPGSFSSGFDRLEGLDAVVVTHQHADHLDRDRLPRVLEANPEARLIVEPQVRELLRSAGVDSEPMTAGIPLDVEGVSLTPVGQWHAVIHEYVPRIGNVGVVLQAADGPRLYHPGDAYDGEPGKVDVLAAPLSAPWTGVRETLAFVRRIAPTVAVPIHDATLSAPGRAMYLQHVATYGGEQTELRDLGDGRPWSVPVG